MNGQEIHSKNNTILVYQVNLVQKSKHIQTIIIMQMSGKYLI